MARKTQRRPDKIELGVVDIHTHVLPGIDDGAEKMALSYRMLRRSYKQGVRKVIATPHYVAYHWRTKPQHIQELMEKLAARVQKAMPDLELYRGAGNPILRRHGRDAPGRKASDTGGQPVCADRVSADILLEPDRGRCPGADDGGLSACAGTYRAVPVSAGKMDAWKS